MKKAVLYLNLGTPLSPEEKDVKNYLKQFLMDPLVIDIPFVLRFLLVRGVIVPFRTKKSSHAYKSIWTDRGSPLRYICEDLVQKLNAKSQDETFYALGMRYGSPSIEQALKLISKQNPDELYVFSAYPQYALSSTETGRLEVMKQANLILGSKTKVYFLESYAKDAGFISACVEQIQRSAKEFQPDHYFFSYHGLPIRHVKKISPSCEGTGNCSLSDSEFNRRCYRRQSYQTTEALVERLGLKTNQYSMGFQSRLSKNWIKPFSDEHYRSLPGRGVKKLLVVCPSFTADCLETLEEVALRGREEFIANGGEDLRLVPCLNDSDLWAQAIKGLLAKSDVWSRL